jgi:phage protein D
LFQTLRSVAGYQTTAEKAAPKPQAKVKAPKQQRSPKAKTVAEQTSAPEVKSPGGIGKVEIASGKKDMALTVRVEVNLPANASQETYDAIFKSIRANLIDE